MHLAAQEQQQINELVAEVEAASGTEFVVAVIGKADAYPEIPWKAFSLGAAGGALLVACAELGLASWPAVRAPAIGLTLVLAAGMVLALMAVFVPAIGRAMLDSLRARAEVEQYARAMFLDRGMFRTKQRAAILLLISRFEREAAIVADAGIREHLTDEQIEVVAAQVAPFIRKGLLVDAVRAALAALAARLRGKLPADADGNELPDEPVQERGS